MMRVQDTVILTAKSRHGKNRISQHGPRWVVTQVSDSVTARGQHFVGDGTPGVFLSSIDCPCRTCETFGQDGRWLLLRNDPNFEIVKDDN